MSNEGWRKLLSCVRPLMILTDAAPCRKQFNINMNRQYTLHSGPSPLPDYLIALYSPVAQSHTTLELWSHEKPTTVDSTQNVVSHDPRQERKALKRRQFDLEEFTQEKRPHSSSVHRVLLLHLKHFKVTPSYKLEKVNDPVDLLRDLIVSSNEDTTTVTGWILMLDLRTQLTAGSLMMTQGLEKRAVTMCVTGGKKLPTSCPTEDRIITFQDLKEKTYPQDLKENMNLHITERYLPIAVHSDRSLLVHRPHVADETNQLLRAFRHSVVRPVLLVVQVKLVPACIQRHGKLLWTVLVTFDPSPFYFLGHHGDDVRLVFPDHLPESWHCGRQRALAGDVEELFFANFHADVAGVDVVLLVSNGNTGFVIYAEKEKLFQPDSCQKASDAPESEMSNVNKALKL
ncbi:hypothetical protein F7725_024078 [Dissostichus mawsoni]|uniref:Uncharacterized protein n=1 Tax=Dissostichus mawsoni TaxID=36200 RepID=A0A7J5Y099_DISMA|nr:hypothetical protein F7725_024078 [Dissostichus mawsoni]